MWSCRVFKFDPVVDFILQPGDCNPTEK
jgi:hypothetical protein